MNVRQELKIAWGWLKFWVLDYVPDCLKGARNNAR